MQNVEKELHRRISKRLRIIVAFSLIINLILVFYSLKATYVLGITKLDYENCVEFLPSQEEKNQLLNRK